jgi:4-hydroxy-tetrahydrodipicolinate synthase
MIRYSLAFDFAAAKKINDLLLKGYDLMFAENNPAGAKAFLAEMGILQNFLRLPVVPLSEPLHEQVKAYLKTMH